MGDLPNLSTLLLDRSGGVLRATINRPETRNALSEEVVADLDRLCAALEPRREIRALVLRGAGGTFCAGGAIGGFRQALANPAPPAGEGDPIAIANRAFGTLLIRFNALPQVTIAVVEGAAFGGGVGLVCVSDIAIADADARFALSETGLGLLPAQIAPFVVRRVGLTAARRIALSGPRLSGAEAAALGLVHFVAGGAAAVEQRLAAVLADIDRCAPAANAATKAILLATPDQPLADVLDAAAAAFARAVRGPEGQEGVQAFLEKRPARWVGQLAEKS